MARDLNIAAVKIGMLATSEVIEAVAGALESLPGVPVVLDPVMVAASGDILLDEDAIDTLRTVLLPRADLITPNLPEAAKLLGRDDSQRRARDVRPGCGAETARRQGRADQRRPCRRRSSGRHLGRRGGELRLAAPRVATGNTHGTGCTLSSAIAAELAKGASLRDAVASAKAYVTAAIAAADELGVGQGRGPVHHFHALWPKGK